MKINEGQFDRVMRGIAALVLLALAIGGVLTGAIKIVALILGAILALTALVGFCPLYTLFKFNTRAKTE